MCYFKHIHLAVVQLPLTNLAWRLFWRIRSGYKKKKKSKGKGKKMTILLGVVRGGYSAERSCLILIASGSFPSPSSSLSWLPTCLAKQCNSVTQWLFCQMFLTMFDIRSLTCKDFLLACISRREEKKKAASLKANFHMSRRDVSARASNYLRGYSRIQPYSMDFFQLFFSKLSHSFSLCLFLSRTHVYTHTQ